MTASVGDSGSIRWSLNLIKSELPDLKTEAELAHETNYQRLVLTYPGAYKEFCKYCGSNDHIYFLLALLDQVPGGQKEEAFEHLGSVLRAINLEEIKNGENTPPKPAPAYDAIERRIIIDKSPIENFLNVLGFKNFRHDTPPEKLDYLGLVGKRVVAFFHHAHWVRENTLEGTTLDLEAFKLILETRNDNTLLNLLSSSIEHFKGKKFELRTLYILSQIKPHALKVSKYFTDPFPEEATSILNAFIEKDENALEYYELYRKEILDFMKITPKGQKDTLLANIRGLNEFGIFEKMAQFTQRTATKNGLLNSIIMGRIQRHGLTENQIEKVLTLFSKYELVTENSSALYLHTFTDTLLKIPERDWENKIQKALTLNKPDMVGDILFYLVDDDSCFNLVVKYQLHTKLLFASLMYALQILPDPEESIIRVLPLLDRYPTEERGSLFYHLYRPYSGADIFHVPLQKAKAVIHIIQTSMNPKDVAHIVPTIKHLLEDDNLEKAQNKECTAAQLIEEHKLSKLLEENL